MWRAPLDLGKSKCFLAIQKNWGISRTFSSANHSRYTVRDILILASRLSALKVCLRIKGIVTRAISLYSPDHRAILWYSPDHKAISRYHPVVGVVRDTVYVPVVSFDLGCQSGICIVYMCIQQILHCWA